jgi:glycosyltransferase involved in cell wall biosynthesis
MYDTLLIIPAYNEELNINKVLTDITELDLSIDLLVINDGSNDKTTEIVKANNYNLISLPYNLGYGGALQTGFKYAVDTGYEYIIQFDGDGQHNAEDINAILEQLKNNSSDIVIGSRFLGKGNFKMSFLKKIAIKFFRFLIVVSTGVRITDPSSGLQGLSKRAFTYYSQMGNYPGDYPDADILIQMILSNYKVCEVPANIRQREFGKSMHAGLKPIFYMVKMLVSILIVLLRKRISVEARNNVNIS